MRLVVPDQTILRGVSATLQWVNVDQTGTPADASGSVSVAVVDAAGAAVSSGSATDATSTTPGLYTFDLTAAEVDEVNVYTATWTDDGDDSEHVTKIEIVGGVIATTEQVRLAHDSVSGRSDEDIAAAIAAATVEVEWICDRSFRHRYARVVLDGLGDRELIVPHNDLLEVLAVSVDGTAYTADEIAELIVCEHRSILQPSGSVWPFDRANVTISYGYGMDAPPPDLAEMFMLRVRQKLNASLSGIPDRATSITVSELGTIQLDKAGKYRVGHPDIDAVYTRWSMRTGTDDNHPVGAYSRQVRFDPQNGSLFHGRRP